MEDEEQKNIDELWKEFLDIINKQLEVNTELKNIVEDFTKAVSPKTAQDPNGEKSVRIQDLFIEMESSLGEERAIYHSLFGIEE
jgi:hypothetical protein